VIVDDVLPIGKHSVYIRRIAVSTTTEPPELLATRLAWMREGTAFFESQLARVDDNELAAPSALSGWTRAHVVAHIARNADALGNLLTWARTGIVTHMYDSAEQRADDIEEGAEQSPRVLRFDLADALRRFADAIATMPEAAWWAEVRTRAGRAIPAAEVPWMRCREVWVHAVDLDVGASFADLPRPFVHAFLDEVVDGFTARPDCGGIELVADDGGLWTIGPHGADEVVVEGEARALLGWLLGREHGHGLTSSAPTLPTIPVWL
jgi:maleylpyruvate isomerase